MRIIKETAFAAFWSQHPHAEQPLKHWIRIVRAAAWQNLQEIRRTLPTADGVRVGRGRTATIFNISGNKYRLVTAVHYDRQRVFVMRFLTHAEYNKGKWKDQL